MSSGVFGCLVWTFSSKKSKFCKLVMYTYIYMFFFYLITHFGCFRWMNSNTSLSHLDGFFLRLRLGKCEAALGGTGYYVACITGKLYCN